jgi:hypothetical protein
MQNEKDFVFEKIMYWFEKKGIKSGHPEIIREKLMTDQKAECISRLYKSPDSRNPEEDLTAKFQTLSCLQISKETKVASILRRRFESKDSMSTRKGSSEDGSRNGSYYGTKN